MFKSDIAYIEALDGVIPFKTFTTLLGKMTSSESMIRLIDKETRLRVLKKTRSIDRLNVIALMGRMKRNNPNTDQILLELKNGEGMNVFCKYREKYFSYLKLQVVNHTAECPHFLICSSPLGVNPLYIGRIKQFHATQGDMFSSCWKTYQHSISDAAEAANRTKNPYDSWHETVVRNFPKSKGLFDGESELFRVLDSKERGLKVAAACIQHVDGNENQGFYYSKIVLALQGIPPDSRRSNMKESSHCPREICKSSKQMPCHSDS